MFVIKDSMLEKQCSPSGLRAGARKGSERSDRPWCRKERTGDLMFNQKCSIEVLHLHRVSCKKRIGAKEGKGKSDFQPQVQEV